MEEKEKTEDVCASVVSVHCRCVSEEKGVSVQLTVASVGASAVPPFSPPLPIPLQFLFLLLLPPVPKRTFGGQEQTSWGGGCAGGGRWLNSSSLHCLKGRLKYDAGGGGGHATSENAPYCNQTPRPYLRPEGLGLGAWTARGSGGWGAMTHRLRKENLSASRVQ